MQAGSGRATLATARRACRDERRALPVEVRSRLDRQIPQRPSDYGDMNGPLRRPRCSWRWRPARDALAKARRQAPLLLYCAGRSRRVSSARGSEIPPLLTLFLWSQVGGATAILCSVKCSPVRDTLNLSIYLSAQKRLYARSVRTKPRAFGSPRGVTLRPMEKVFFFIHTSHTNSPA